VGDRGRQQSIPPDVTWEQTSAPASVGVGLDERDWRAEPVVGGCGRLFVATATMYRAQIVGGRGIVSKLAGYARARWWNADVGRHRGTTVRRWLAGKECGKFRCVVRMVLARNPRWSCKESKAHYAVDPRKLGSSGWDAVGESDSIARLSDRCRSSRCVSCSASTEGKQVIFSPPPWRSWHRRARRRPGSFVRPGSCRESVGGARRSGPRRMARTRRQCFVSSSRRCAQGVRYSRSLRALVIHTR